MPVHIFTRIRKPLFFPGHFIHRSAADPKELSALIKDLDVKILKAEARKPGCLPDQDKHR